MKLFIFIASQNHAKLDWTHAKWYLTHTKLDWTNMKLDLTYIKLDLTNVRFRFKIFEMLFN